jgi:signal transduction histidine kinase
VSGHATLNRIIHGRVSHIGRARGLSGGRFAALHEDQKGNLWIATTGAGLYRKTASGFFAIRSSAKLDAITVIASDASGHVWAADARKGLFAVSGDYIKPVTAIGLGDSTGIYSMIDDQGGRLWIGNVRGEIAIVESGRTTYVTPGNRPLLGPISALYKDTQGCIWACGSTGLARFRGNHWTVWTPREGLPQGGVWSIIEDNRGAFWASTESGIIHFSASELQGQADGFPKPFRISLEEMSQNAPPTRGCQPHVTKSADGRLWFATQEGIVFVNPNQGDMPALPAPPEIEALTVDDTPVELTRVASKGLALRGHRLQLDYTAPSLSSQNLIRFQFRLDGFDRAWVEAGARRQFYSNLSPGHYRFLVSACTPNGLCAARPAELGFDVLPAFYQTYSFRLACLALAAAILWGMYRFRIAQIARQFDLRLEERLAERSRIARELHDTLLQSVVGVSLQLNVIADRVKLQSDSEHAHLQRIRRQVDEALRETRHSVWALRSPALATRNLATALAEAATSLTSGHKIKVQMSVEGKPRPYPAEIEEQLLRIVHEAIGNAVLHSRAGEVCISLHYHSWFLQLLVSDNGQGMDAELLKNGRPGHFGLCGMRERAQRIGADFSLRSAPGAGTAIEMTVVRSKDFSHKPGLSLWLSAAWQFLFSPVVSRTASTFPQQDAAAREMGETISLADSNAAEEQKPALEDVRPRSTRATSAGRQG